VGSPNVVDTVTISTRKMDFAYAENSSLKQLVAHELTHALNVRHHGDWIEFNICGSGSSVAVWGGQSSGNESCYMRYDESSFTHYKAQDGQCYEYPTEDRISDYICESIEGTSYNTGSRRMENGISLPIAGPAGEFGDCVHKITLKGNRYDGY